MPVLRLQGSNEGRETIELTLERFVMSMSSALNAGVSGLSANSSKLATISDNIANSKTHGYKRADVDFSSLVLSERRGSYFSGGVRISSFRQVENQGALLTTNSATDIAIGGRGMLPVTPVASVDTDDISFPLQLVTTGSFKPDETGLLRTESGLALLGWPADINGDIPAQPRDSSLGLEPVYITYNQFASNATSEISLGVNLPAQSTVAGSSGDPIDLSVEYYDNLSASQTLTITFTPTVAGVGGSNEWTLSIVDSATGAAPVSEFVVTFDDNAGTGGSIASVTPVFGGTYDATEGTLDFAVVAGPLSLNIGSPLSGGFLTQLAADYAPTQIAKNGAQVGSLVGVDIDENGILSARYDTGFTRNLYQIPLADFANLNGLTAIDNQAFQVSTDSGPLYFWDAGSGPTGSVIGYAREESTSDIAAELTQLIQTQRAYSSNAKVIQTVDEMLQETTNIKR